MRITLFALVASLAATKALPAGDLEPRAKHNTFLLNILNNCPFEKEVAIYKVTSSFGMKQITKPVTIKPHQKHTMHAPYLGIGLRLSGHAEWGTAGQWKPQALFEFGHGTAHGAKGTAWDLSVMSGSDSNIGIGAYPHNPKCASKTCFPLDCPPSQGWTSPGQVSNGSPADGGCYHGKTDFKVVFCP